MSLNCTRMLAYFTFIAYLAVSSVAFRFLMPTNTDLVISTEYLNAFSNSKMVKPAIEVSAPEMHFADIVVPTERKIVAKKTSYVKVAVLVQEKRDEIVPTALAANELPFADPIKLSPVIVNNELPVNLVSLYKDFSFEEKTLVASNEVIDEVTTSSAKD